MSRHDPSITLRQIADHARKAQQLCTQNTFDGLLWQSVDAHVPGLPTTVERMLKDLEKPAVAD